MDVFQLFRRLRRAFGGGQKPYHHALQFGVVFGGRYADRDRVEHGERLRGGKVPLPRQGDRVRHRHRHDDAAHHRRAAQPVHDVRKIGYSRYSVLSHRDGERARIQLHDPVRFFQESALVVRGGGISGRSGAFPHVYQRHAAAGGVRHRIPWVSSPLSAPGTIT